MNFVKYIYILLIVFFVSCADNSVQDIGKMEIQVKEFFITPTEAIVEVSIPHPDTNCLEEVIEISLVKDDINNYESINNNWDSTTYKYIKGNRVFGEGSQYKDKCIYAFDDLTASTTYYIVVTCKVAFDFAGTGQFVKYYTGYSFKTKRAGDYSGLGKALCGYSKVEKDRIFLNVTLPNNLEIDGIMTLYASENKNMKDPISSSDNGLTFVFPTFPQKVFYFRLKGDFKVYLDKNHYVVYTDETIDFENSIDFLSLYESLGY